MTIMEGVFREEYDRLERMKRAFTEDYNKLPKGYISAKKISGRTYYYLQWRDGKKIRSRYIKTDELEDLQKQLALKKRIKQSLDNIEANFRLLKRVLKV